MNNPTHDTVELLKECSSGIKMGVASIDKVLDKVKDKKLEQLLSDNKLEHEKYEHRAQELLSSCGATAKEPNPMAKGMSWIKTNVMLNFDESDGTVADLITGGCDMGIKSLNKYLNKYERADTDAKTLAKDIISLETKLCEDLRTYL